MQYDQVVSYLADYGKFVRRINRRVAPMMFTSPREYSRLNTETWKTLWRLDPLSERTLNAARLAVSACANDEERKHLFFSIATSDYPTDALSDGLKKQFDSFNFEKLKKIHDSKQNQLARFSAKQILGVIFAASALILKSVPKIVVESLWGIGSYDDFEKNVFYVTVGLAAYILLVLLPSWIKYGRAKRTNQRVGDILEYTVIKNA